MVPYSLSLVSWFVQSSTLSHPFTTIPPAQLMPQVTWPKCFCQAHPLQGDPVQSSPVNIREQNRNWVPYFLVSHFSFLEGKRIKGGTTRSWLMPIWTYWLIAWSNYGPSIRRLSGHWPSTLIRHGVTLSASPAEVQTTAPLLTAIRARFTLCANPIPPSQVRLPEWEIYQPLVSFIRPKPGHLFSSS